MILYIDTQIAVWLSESRLKSIPPNVRLELDSSEVRISPMAVLELEYLYEIDRITASSQKIIAKLQMQIGLTVCDYPFPAIAAAALYEDWTRDPFDRIIVAHARANQEAGLVSADRMIRKHYAKAVWSSPNARSPYVQ